MTPKQKNKTPWWGYAIAIPLAILVLPGAAVILTAYILAVAAIYISIWLTWNTRGKDILFVYSNSSIWKEHIETQILPHLGDRAVILNWSERQTWRRMSLGPWAFRHFGGYREFNPLAVVFTPWQRAKLFRFWKPFRDFKHGDNTALKKIQEQFFQTLKVHK